MQPYVAGQSARSCSVYDNYKPLPVPHLHTSRKGGGCGTPHIHMRMPQVAEDWFNVRWRQLRAQIFPQALPCR